MRLLLWILASIALCLLPATQCAVFSVDLGSEWMKVAVVDVKPGQSPINIALNEMSKRKSPALVAFSDGSRLLAEQAIGIAARYPQRVYARVRDMVGRPMEAVKNITESRYLPYDFVVGESPLELSIRVDGGEVYRTEELLAMILGYCRNLAAGVHDAVITVPPYFGQAERRAVIAAAEAAGINVLSLMNEHAAAALQYGIDRDFVNESRKVLFYDMGANSAYAAVVHFSSYSVKQVVKEVSTNYFELKGIRWDADIGGQEMEMRLVEHLASEFEKEAGVDVRKFPKSMAKLKKQAKRAKEVLSANAEAQVFVDSLHDDRDFKSKITRELFEALCTDIWTRAAIPIQKVLEDAGLKVEELDAVELLGGATRVPRLQQALSKALGDKRPLERHLDSDEAIALGAALHAANISEGIKLRKFGMVDRASYGIFMNIVSPGSDEVIEELVVPRLMKLPSKFSRAVKKQEDFEGSMFYDAAGELPPGTKSKDIFIFNVTGLTDAVAKYSSHNLSAPIKTSLHLSLSRGGVLSLDRAEAVVDITEWVEVPLKNNSTSNTTTTDTDGTAKEDTNATSPSTASEEVKAERKLRRRVIRVPLKLDIGNDVGSISEEKISEFRSRLSKLDEIDEEKRLTEESRNGLESYIYTTKEMMESMSKDLAKVSTKEQRDKFLAKLDESAEWLYSDGESASFRDFSKRLKELKAMGDPIFFRHEQLQARPASVEAAGRYIKEVESTVEGWKSSKPWISDAEVRKEIAAFQKWLANKQAQQAKLQNHAEPAFTSEGVYSKMEKIITLVSKTGRQAKPKPKVVVNEKANATSNETEAEGKQQQEQEQQQKQEEQQQQQEQQEQLDSEPQNEEPLRDEL